MARELGFHAGRDALLRQLRQRQAPGPVASPRVLGVEQWVWRKGHRYGAILCDLERGVVVDFLPDRDTGTLERWFKPHPGGGK